jgi:hypothetical protein
VPGEYITKIELEEFTSQMNWKRPDVEVEVKVEVGVEAAEQPV